MGKTILDKITNCNLNVKVYNRLMYNFIFQDKQEQLLKKSSKRIKLFDSSEIDLLNINEMEEIISEKNEQIKVIGNVNLFRCDSYFDYCNLSKYIQKNAK